jgi:hypothetical protein
MVEEFGKEIGRHLLSWSGWLFTVAIGILSLWWAKEHWWISLLIVLTFAGAALTLSYQNHRQTQKAEERHDSEMNASRAREQAMADRVQEVERKLLEVPSGILLQLQRIIGQHSTSALGRLLIARSELIARMKNFSLALNKPLKGRVKASHVQATLTFATTLSRDVVRSPLSGLRTTNPFADYQETVYETLPLDESTVTALKTELKVRVGDLVRSMQ